MQTRRRILSGCDPCSRLPVIFQLGTRTRAAKETSGSTASRNLFRKRRRELSSLPLSSDLATHSAMIFRRKWTQFARELVDCLCASLSFACAPRHFRGVGEVGSLARLQAFFGLLVLLAAASFLALCAGLSSRRPFSAFSRSFSVGPR